MCVNESGMLVGADMSDAVSFHAAVDVDFNQDTPPLVRTLSNEVDGSKAASGIIAVPLDCSTCGLFNLMNRKRLAASYI